MLAFWPEIHDVRLDDVLLREYDVERRRDDDAAAGLFVIAQESHQMESDALEPQHAGRYHHHLAVVQLVAPAVVRPLEHLGVGDASFRRVHPPHSTSSCEGHAAAAPTSSRTNSRKP